MNLKNYSKKKDANKVCYYDYTGLNNFYKWTQGNQVDRLLKIVPEVESTGLVH